MATTKETMKVIAGGVNNTNVYYRLLQEPKQRKLQQKKWLLLVGFNILCMQEAK